jgi:hypothetical protein
MQSVPITTDFVSSNPANGEIQHYVIKFVSDCGTSVVFSGYYGFLHLKHYNLNPIIIDHKTFNYTGTLYFLFSYPAISAHQTFNILVPCIFYFHLLSTLHLTWFHCSCKSLFITERIICSFCFCPCSDWVTSGTWTRMSANFSVDIKASTLFNQRLSRACIVHLVIKKNNWSYVKTMSCVILELRST